MEGRLDKRFLQITKEALRSVASLTDQLNGAFNIPSDGSKASISRLSAYLHLLYHQVRQANPKDMLSQYSDKHTVHSGYNKTIALQLSASPARTVGRKSGQINQVKKRSYLAADVR